MHKSLVVLAILGTMTVPATAQTAPAPDQAQPARPQTAKKVVCRRVDDEETTGSRLGSAPKVCKEIEVPATGGSARNGQQAPAPERGAGNSF